MDQAKQNGTLNGKAKSFATDGKEKISRRCNTAWRRTLPFSLHPNSAVLQIRDSTWDIVPITIGTPPEYRNDDGSTGLIPLPFTFLSLRNDLDGCYIIHGNVSFGAPYELLRRADFRTASCDGCSFLVGCGYA